MSGLQAIGAQILVQQRISVPLADPVVGELLFRIVGIVLGKILDRPLREHRQVVGGGQVFRIGPAGGVAKDGVAHTQFPAAFGHLLGERFLALQESLRDDDGGVVTRLDDDALDQVLHLHLGQRFQEHGRAAAFGPAFSPCVLAHRQGVIQFETAVPQPFEQQIDGHQLAHRGRRHRLVGVLFEQDGAGSHFHQQGLTRRGLECRRRKHRRRDRDGKDED